jgi:hypothetical protein
VDTAAPFYFELVAVARPLKDSLPLELRLLPLAPPSSIVAAGLQQKQCPGCGDSGAGLGSVVTVPVGRSHQQALFKAWLPQDQEWRCISRKAFEVSWERGSLAHCTLKLHAGAGSPLVVNGALVTPGATVPIRPGSEVNLVWSGKVLLCLRFWSAKQYWQQQQAHIPSMVPAP